MGFGRCMFINCFFLTPSESLFRGETPISSAEPRHFRDHHRCNKQLFHGDPLDAPFSDTVLSVTFAADLLDMKLVSLGWHDSSMTILKPVENQDAARRKKRS